jgi:3-hydroxybutyryl-CoA dehydrogenase
MKRVRTTDNLGEAVLDAQFVVECATENLKIKQDIFKQIDEICDKETILSSNSSVIRPTEIASKSDKRYRMLGTHFWNPAHLIPCVEVIKAEETSEEVFDLTYELMKKAGKKPVKCLKDVTGFIANRLQHALWRQAISIVENGIADAATVDETIKNAYAIRLPVLGPLENIDMIGLDLTLDIHDIVFPEIDSRDSASPLLREKVKSGDMGFKSGRGFYNWTHEQSEKSEKSCMTIS